MFIPVSRGRYRMTIANTLGPAIRSGTRQFSSTDLQITRPFTLHLGERQLKMRAGGAVFNLFNHDNPRDVQTIVNSSQFGGFYNDAWRTFRGKLVFQF